MKRKWLPFHKWKAQRVRRIGANTWNLDQQLERDEREREYIREDIRKRQQPEVDQWNQDFYGTGDKPK